MLLSWTSLGTAKVSSALGEATKLIQQCDLQEEPPHAEQLLTSPYVPALQSPENLFLPDYEIEKSLKSAFMKTLRPDKTIAILLFSKAQPLQGCGLPPATSPLENSPPLDLTQGLTVKNIHTLVGTVG